MSTISDHAAAWAAGLHRAGAGNWDGIAAILRMAGFGHHHRDELAAAAMAWETAHVSDEAIKFMTAAGVKPRPETGPKLKRRRKRSAPNA